MNVQLPLFLSHGAKFSPCRTWRYLLWRRWDEEHASCAFIGLNPSTADETDDDPTVRRCIGYAKRWGFGALYMLNVFGYRSTDPKGLLGIADPVGPDNDAMIMHIKERSELVVAAWGMHGSLHNRDLHVLQLLDDVNVWCLGTTKAGFPRHPLYMPLNAHRQAYSSDKRKLSY